MQRCDCLVIGGGVMGLSLAYELAGQALAVRLVDRQEPGREASWAGAGILPPARRGPNVHPHDQLAAMSNELHAQWSADLLRQTGVDNGFRRCGAIYLAVDDDSQRDLAAKQEDWRRQGIVAEPLSPAALIALEPSLAGSAALQRLRAACFVPEEAQIRNPRHLRALCAACALRGVSVEAFIRCDGFDLDGNRVRAARTSAGPLAADSFCIAGGAWSGAIAGSLGLALAVKPIRGQIVLFRCPRPLLSRIINIGRRYLVPRDDGRVLVGSTEEDVGFNCGTTDEAIQELTEVAFRVAPALARVPVERSWAGLRPASPDGLPYIGRVPPLANLYVAAGHYRGGLQLSTGTAVLVSAMLRGQEPPIDPIPFAVDRAGDPRPDA